MYSKANSAECAINKLLLEQVLESGALPIGTIRQCGECAGAAVLRESRLGSTPVPCYGNPDGTLRDDECPVHETITTDMAFGDMMLGQAIRGEPLQGDDIE